MLVFCVHVCVDGALCLNIELIALNFLPTPFADLNYQLAADIVIGGCSLVVPCPPIVHLLFLTILVEYV